VNGTPVKNTVACFVVGRVLGRVADAKTDKMLSMTRSDIIAALAVRFPHLTPKDAAIAVKEILDAIGHSLAQGDRFEIRGFGSFGLNFRPARTGRNPKSGETVLVAPKYVPHFKAGKAMRERVEASDQVKPVRQVA